VREYSSWRRGLRWEKRLFVFEGGVVVRNLNETEKVITHLGRDPREDHMAQGENDSAIPSRLKEFVERFEICWEALPDYYYVKKEKRQIGFTLELTGTHERGVEHPEPGCEHCRHVRVALQEIADWILPKEKRDSDYDIVPYDQSIHYTAVRKFRPDVSLRIGIRHRSGFDRELDECEVRCLGEMTQRLAKIGAHQGQWESNSGADLGDLFRTAARRHYGA
jgi:hypothetical protein